MTAPSLFDLLAEPARASELTGPDWNRLIRRARREFLLGTLATRLEDTAIPDRARTLLAEGLEANRLKQGMVRFEVERMETALAHTGIPVILMKGAAYLEADLPPIPGRHIGDLDIMVPEDRLAETEAALKAAGWASIKATGSYDDDYYRQWMHELPPLAHRKRGHVIDLHHNILPRTARLNPSAAAMFERARNLRGNIHVMGDADMLLHSATHLAYDGDFLGGARNLWDIDRLSREFGARTGFWDELEEAAKGQELAAPLARALRLANSLYGTPAPERLRGSGDLVDSLALRKLRHRDPFGNSTTPIADFLLFCRGHWLRMPPLMLARHLTTKWRARRREAHPEAP